MKPLFIPPGLNIGPFHRILSRMGKFHTQFGFDYAPDEHRIDCSTVVISSDTDYVTINGVTFGFDVAGNGLGQAASATITCIAQASLVDETDSFTLQDTSGTSETFYYDVAGDGGGTGTPIDVSGASTKEQVATATAAAIDAAAIAISAPAPSDEHVLLSQDVAGDAGNTTPAESVSDAGFTITAFTGGTTVTRDVTVDVYPPSSNSVVATALANAINGVRGSLLPKWVKATALGGYVYVRGAQTVTEDCVSSNWAVHNGPKLVPLMLGGRGGVAAQL